MLSSFIVAGLAAGALAVPFENEKRDIVTDVDWVVVTDIVTVYATGAPQSVGQAEWSHPGSSWWATLYPSASTTSTPAPPPPASTTWTPAPVPTTSSAPVVVVVPTTSSTPVYVAPTTTWVAPSSTSVAPVASSSAPASSWGSGSSYSDIVVNQHNLHRANHSAPALTWDAGLAATAQKIANLCTYAHNTQMDGGGYGQNIAAGVAADNVSVIITDLFYNGEVNWFLPSYYGESQPDMTNFEHWGHFSQIVWDSTTTVGCASTYCSNGLANTGSDVSPWFTVCNYGPPGNYANEYGSNIFQSLGKPSVYGDSVWVQ